jgi:hypothetical protein
MSQVTTEDADLLIAARTSWEALRDELASHAAERDVYLCLACHRRAQQFDDAVKALSRRINS